MLKLDLTVQEMLDILETAPVGVPARTLKRKVNLCLDSREKAKGVVFWPIKGARFDAHKFVSQMEKDGALMSVVNQESVEQNAIKMYAPVDDTTKALLKLAKGYQRLFKLKKVAITGSNGKTTTKEMTKAVLSMKFNTHATQGNFNNHIGVPMTLFQLKHSHEAAVVEMGTSGPDEIRPLSLATEPDVAVITNIGASHLERLKDLDGVFNEKITIKDGLKAGGTLIVNADDAHLCKVRSTKNMKVVTFGVRRGMVKPEKLAWNANACADFYIGRTHFVLNVPGDHNLYDALAAIAVGEALRIPKGDIAKALAGFTSTSMRMEIKIAILGDMLELGAASKDLHREIGRLVPEMNFDLLLAVGEQAKEFVKGAEERGMAHAFHFDSVKDAIEFLGDVVSEGDVLLVKGSRGMKMEQVVEALMNFTPAKVK